MKHWQDKIDHTVTETQGFQNLKENKSYHVISEFISSDHKYMDRAPLSHKGVAAENGKHEHMQLCSGTLSKLCPRMTSLTTVNHSAKLKVKHFNLIAPFRGVSCSIHKPNNVDSYFNVENYPCFSLGLGQRAQKIRLDI